MKSGHDKMNTNINELLEKYNNDWRKASSAILTVSRVLKKSRYETGEEPPLYNHFHGISKSLIEKNSVHYCINTNELYWILDIINKFSGVSMTRPCLSLAR